MIFHHRGTGHRADETILVFGQKLPNLFDDVSGKPGWHLNAVVSACMASLIASLLTFIYDIHLSLVALKLELQEVKPDMF